MSDASATAPQTPDVKRRDFLFIATGVMAGVGAALAAWPIVDEMNPSADVLAAGGPLTIDLSSVASGQQITVMWRSRPIFIVHRTPANLKELKNPALLSRLRDPDCERMQQPAYAKNWSRSLKPDYLVLVGICTHLGCIPAYTPKPGSISATWSGGYLCHCHGSKYDLAGRVFQDVPAPLNLPVPPYHFEGDTKLVIGENPKGESYSLGQVEAL